MTARSLASTASNSSNSSCAIRPPRNSWLRRVPPGSLLRTSSHFVSALRAASHFDSAALLNGCSCGKCDPSRGADYVQRETDYVEASEDADGPSSNGRFI